MATRDKKVTPRKKPAARGSGGLGDGGEHRRVLSGVMAASAGSVSMRTGAGEEQRPRWLGGYYTKADIGTYGLQQVAAHVGSQRLTRQSDWQLEGSY